MIQCNFQAVFISSGEYESRGKKVKFISVADNDRIIRIHQCPLSFTCGEFVNVPCEMNITSNGNFFFVYNGNDVDSGVDINPLENNIL